jgi:hypothetical protein
MSIRWWGECRDTHKEYGNGRAVFAQPRYFSDVTARACGVCTDRQRRQRLHDIASEEYDYGKGLTVGSPSRIVGMKGRWIAIWTW